MDKFEVFSQLHHQDEAFLLGNVWNAHSAQSFQKAGFKAVGTSSAAISNSMGYEDGEKMSFAELLFIVERIAAAISIPLSVDIEGGYGSDITGITDNIEKLYNIGAAGINIEDSLTGSKREISAADVFSKNINAIKEYLLKNNIKMFLNVRTDTYLLGLPSPLEETLKRVEAYEKAGADGIFVPCIVENKDIKEVVSSTKLPINVMCMPGLSSFTELSKAGVKRISMGNFFYNNMVENLEQTISVVNNEDSFDYLFKK